MLAELRNPESLKHAGPDGDLNATLREYQATGVPTIAPRYPAIVGAMDHGQEGMLFEPRDMDEAAPRERTL